MSADDIIALGERRLRDWLQYRASLTAEHARPAKLQRKVIKMHLNGVPAKSIATTLGISAIDVAAILKAFKSFISKRAF